jgi:hypothetical protein
MSVLHVEHVADGAVCADLVGGYRSACRLPSPTDQHGNPVISVTSARLPRATSVTAVEVVRACLAVTAKAQGCGRLFPETALLTRLGGGQGHLAHADNERLVADRWEPNHTPHRDFAGILYLSSSTGGRLCFESDELAGVEPVAGRYVTFPCDHRFVHRVDPVERGDRYSLALWFTRDATRADVALTFALARSARSEALS